MQEAIDVLLPYLDDTRQIRFESGDFFKKLNAAKDNQYSYDKIEGDFGQETRIKLQSLERGSAIIRFPSSSEELAASIWIGKNNVSLMLNKEEINSILFLLS